MVAGDRITGSCSSRCRFPHLLTGASVRKRRSSGAEGRAADPADGESARCGRCEGRAAAATWLVAARPNLRPVDRTCAGAARTATPRWRRSERRTRSAPARRRRKRGRGNRPRPVTAGSPTSISPRRQQVPIRVAFGPPGQASIGIGVGRDHVPGAWLPKNCWVSRSSSRNGSVRINIVLHLLKCRFTVVSIRTSLIPRQRMDDKYQRRQIADILSVVD